MIETTKESLNSVPTDLRSVLEALVARAVEFAEVDAGPGDIHEAWRAFRVWLSPWIDLDADDWGLFLQWFVFHWGASRRKNGGRAGPASIAERFARSDSSGLSEGERSLLLEGTKMPPDFYEIFDFSDLGILYVKSLLLGFRYSFAATDVPGELRPGDIFFGKMMPMFEDRGVVIGFSKPLPRSAKLSIAQLRLQLVNHRKSDFVTDFSLFEPDVLNLYYDILHT